jgi:short chain dehydrogenase
MNLHLDDKLALVTASTVGIGKAIATTFAREGATVIVSGRTAASVDAAIADIRARVPGAKLERLVADNGTAEVAGVWRWRVPTPTGEQHYALRLQQRFQEVSGTISSDDGEIPITNARLTGDQLRFAAATGVQGRQVKIFFNGSISGNIIQGRAEVQGGTSAGQYDWTAHRDADGVPAVYYR